jgi:hypothetical protein
MNVPVLARVLEENGLSTVIVTMMPFWAEKIGVPRTLAVEFPFGHTLGQPHNAVQQMRVIREALDLLGNAKEAGTIRHSSETWPVPPKQAYKAWQPEQPSPIIAHLAPQIRQMLREQRQG